MIRPKPKGSQTVPRLMSGILTVALLLGVYTSLKGLPVPSFASGREVIRELDALILERFALSQPPETEAPEETPAEEEPEEIVETVSFEQEVGQAMEGLERLFGSEEEVAASTGARTNDPVTEAAAGIAADALDDRFESLFGATENVPVGRAGRGRTTSTRAEGGLGIGINETLANTTEEPVDTPEGAGPDVTVSTAAERAETTGGTDVVISEYEPENFDGTEADRLAAWMRANPAPLPVGVRVHTNFEPTFLTASVPFISDGQRWDLYLMFNETLRELHIVLVEGDRSVYMIDRGFQEQSRSLREGTVRRSGGQIVAVDSRGSSASGDRAKEFYNVFLSWWETAKTDVGSR